MRKSVKWIFFTAGIMWLIMGMDIKIIQASAIRQGNVVKVVGVRGSWHLNVNGDEFRIKGVGVGRAVGKDRVNYLSMAKELGANTVRTWGTDQGNRKYLNTASEYGLYVDAGIWLNPVLENSAFSYKDKDYLRKTRNEVLKYVRRYRNHPAVILWNIGNETIYWTKDEEERVAFAQFLERLIQDVHRIDPDHPVLYTAASTIDIPYLKKYVPSLDIIGVNAYGGFDQLHKNLSEWFDVPYLITEFGSLGEWSRSKDIRGVSFELSDESKMSYYKQYAHQIKSHYGYCLGGFAFYLGDTTQVSLTWWNINHENKKKYSFLAIEDFYKDRPYQRAPFVVKNVRLEKNRLNPSEEFEVAVELKNVLHPAKPVDYAYLVSTASEAVLMEYPNRIVAQGDKGRSAVFKVRAPKEPGIYRFYAIASQEDYASVLNKSIKVSIKQDGHQKRNKRRFKMSKD